MKIERKCTIVSKERMGDAVYMVLEVGDMVRTTFQNPGQFIHIKCGEGLLLRRPISVCSCMEDDPSDLLAIVFEVRGEGTDWLAQRMEGEQLDVLGLAGNGFNVKRDGRYLLVGGGHRRTAPAGLCPKHRRQVHRCFGVSLQREVCFVKELSE